ncbi:MAG: hypothetical protein A3I29_00210 [Candidatus Magasanikbacteria bacterium RIFCSPLOWO2_02_FULL_44_11]|uniref:PrgI family protein n=2 Tax=Candidatus Magasanikiibacteriota TaxID=1752731 RepID=A0A1F6NAQ6_9BACT|nr:MAG: hypothetical protein A3D53_01920 [Candidatus Magasanikbacteria bacterium RIFCSPHIGHO2_02_FULL_45_10]OGH80987.1 MAG: hypothetical protein A3I29_00210 [Candidatus Magasanikbacteria bacterium RIFCSPLOWO2_02_FULL_44_11]
MNQFMVPQFIDVEDKIFGPITTRQFITLLVGGLLIFISFKTADTTLFIVLLALIGGLTLLLAFVKINGQPFHFFLLNITQTTFSRPRRRVWNKYYKAGELKDLIAEGMPEALGETKIAAKTLSHSRIRDLSLMVNTGGYYKGNE